MRAMLSISWRLTIPLSRIMLSSRQSVDVAHTDGHLASLSNRKRVSKSLSEVSTLCLASA